MTQSDQISRAIEEVMAEKKNGKQERLDLTEGAYFDKIQVDLREAESMQREILELENRVRELRTIIERRVGARDSFIEHLASKYRLVDGDRIEEDWTIIRKAAT